MKYLKQIKDLVWAATLAIVFSFILVFLLTVCSLAATKPPIKVYVIDTGLDLNDSRFKAHLCKMGHKDFTGTGLKDTIGHGTAIVGLIAHRTTSTNYCIVVYKYYEKSARGSTTLARLQEAIAWAAAASPEIVNISSSGYYSSPVEYADISKAYATMFVVAAGNQGIKNKSYPAGYDLPNITSVGSINRIGTVSKFSNYGAWVKAWRVGEDVPVDTIHNGMEIGKGTSYSCAIYTAELLSDWGKKSKSLKGGLGLHGHAETGTTTRAVPHPFTGLGDKQ